MLCLAAGPPSRARGTASSQPLVVEIALDGAVQPVTARYVINGISYANRIHAAAVLLELNTPGGLEDSMREIIEAIVASSAPVITYVAPSGARAASAGFFILMAGDLAVMAPGTNTGAAHPVVLGGVHVGKTEETKIENDAAAYMRAIAEKRGRNVQFAEDAVLKSLSYTYQEALDDHLIDAVASSPQDIFRQFDGKAIRRFDGTNTTLRLAGARILAYRMSSFNRFLSWLADPNIAFILGALGLLGLYVEFTHPGFVLPGVAGAVAVVLALFGFHLLPINYIGALLIVVALALFVMEAKLTTHGILALGGVIAMVVGSMILINSSWPGTQIHLSTSLSVTVPLAVITIFLMRLAWAAKLQKSVTGQEGLMDAVGVARTDLTPTGKVLVHGELWEARALENIPNGAQVRVREVQGLTLVVEAVEKSR
jgi:membrane-bound serine protease (ClpP class)